VLPRPRLLKQQKQQKQQQQNNSNNKNNNIYINNKIANEYLYN